MRLTKQQRVYVVTEPIEAIEASPGDELVLSPGLEGFELVVMKRFGIEMAAAVPEAAVRVIDVEPASEAARPALFVVRQRARQRAPTANLRQSGFRARFAATS